MSRIEIIVDGDTMEFPDELLPVTLAAHGTDDPRVLVINALVEIKNRAANLAARQASEVAGDAARRGIEEAYAPVLAAIVPPEPEPEPSPNGEAA